MGKAVTIEIISGVEGYCVTINDYRVAGPKPWGGGQVVRSFKTTQSQIDHALRRTQPEITGNTSDGYHTFNELYHHRAMLFSVICNDRLDRAWKSKMHHDGTMYDGMFIVGIQTPNGQATYHYDIDPYWDMFRVPELPQAPEWDGHTSEQAIERIGRLTQPENKPLTLDDLKQMDGEPVWVMHQDGSGARWGIVKDTEYGLCAVVDDDTAYWFTDVCGTIAYRSKPKEEVCGL